MNQNHGYPSGQMPNMQNNQDMKDLCMKYMNYHVITQMSDGTQMEGILENVDDDGVTMLVPEDVEAEDDRFYGGYGGFGGYGRRRFRRFRRRRFPFFAFGFPFIFPFPYYF
ncbi:hypothetical protein [Bacillus tuaregi]|uniref:hypothetical protein n=1 Tax=Bacillus tuaregi TaxID=1816695 RepID=UPI001F37D137|nr:hypothetical protein [Bacillus tuaregi]